MMKIAQNSLFMKGIVKLQKKEIVETFEREYSHLESKRPVRDAYELHPSWKQISEGKIDPERLKSFVEETKVFTRNIKVMARGQGR